MNEGSGAWEVRAGAAAGRRRTTKSGQDVRVPSQSRHALENSAMFRETIGAQVSNLCYLQVPFVPTPPARPFSPLTSSLPQTPDMFPSYRFHARRNTDPDDFPRAENCPILGDLALLDSRVAARTSIVFLAVPAQ